jgi:hypothetical protein
MLLHYFTVQPSTRVVPQAPAHSQRISQLPHLYSTLPKPTAATSNRHASEVQEPAWGIEKKTLKYLE